MNEFITIDNIFLGILRIQQNHLKHCWIHLNKILENYNFLEYANVCLFFFL